MKRTYPIIIYEKFEDEKYHGVYIPDFNASTQGKNVAQSIDMARDLISFLILDLTRKDKDIPLANISSNKYAFEDDEYKILNEVMVDIDIEEYEKSLNEKNSCVKSNFGDILQKIKI